LNMRLLTTLYGDVSNPNGIAVPDDVIQNFDLSPDGNTGSVARNSVFSIIHSSVHSTSLQEAIN
jgi:hypothetical protein